MITGWVPGTIAGKLGTRVPVLARSGRPTGTCIGIGEGVQGVQVRISAQLGRQTLQTIYKLCKFVSYPYGLTQDSRNSTESSVKALFSAARETPLTRFLAVPGAPVHTTVLGGSHVHTSRARSPMSTQAPGGGARREYRKIEFSNSRILSSNFVL